MARISARAHKVTSYASDLDSDDVAPPDANSSGEEFEADDTTVPGGESDPGVIDEAESESGEEYDDSGSSAGGSRRIPTTRAGTADLRTPGSAAQVHRRHVRSIDGGKGRGRRRDRMIAEGASAAALRIPDPTVRITYKPGYSKASGKMDRMVQVYGCDEGDLKRAVIVRDRWISSSAIPERSSFAVTPFWEDGEGVAKEDIGEGEQKVVIGFDAVKEGYLQQEGECVRCVLGRVGKWEKIVFRRFMIYDLSMIGEEKKGFMLNAGGHVLGLAWATNRPEGMSSTLDIIYGADVGKGCQYLAVSTLTEGEPIGEKEDDQEIPPAYDRRPSKSAIQIWRFPVDAATPSPVENPSIALLLCHDWGPARCLKWCPELQVFNDTRVLGYLAAVFADGTARVLKVIIPETYDSSSPDADGCDFRMLTLLAGPATTNKQQ
jgi:transcription factor C subunit 6